MEIYFCASLESLMWLTISHFSAFILRSSTRRCLSMMSTIGFHFTEPSCLCSQAIADWTEKTCRDCKTKWNSIFSINFPLLSPPETRVLYRSCRRCTFKVNSGEVRKLNLITSTRWNLPASNSFQFAAFKSCFVSSSSSPSLTSSRLTNSSPSWNSLMLKILNSIIFPVLCYFLLSSSCKFKSFSFLPFETSRNLIQKWKVILSKFKGSEMRERKSEKRRNSIAKVISSRNN